MEINFKHSRENKMYVMVIIILTVLFTVFFTSKYWLYDDSAVAQTPFDKDINGLSGTKVILRDWQYNPKNKLMELKLETTQKENDGLTPSYKFEALSRDKSQTFNAEKTYQSDNNIVVHIHDVPNDFKQIVLKIVESRSQIETNQVDVDSENDIDEANNAEEDSNSTNGTKSDVVVMGDYREITINETLEQKTKTDYKTESIKEEIKRIQDEMQAITKDSIPVKEEEINRLKDEQIDLEREIAYQTSSEKEQTEQEIEAKQEKAERANEDIKSLKSELEELYDKYNKRKDKLDNLFFDDADLMIDAMEREKVNMDMQEKRQEELKKQKEEKEKKDKKKKKKKKKKKDK